MSRHRPNENAVRDQMRVHPARSDDDGAGLDEDPAPADADEASHVAGEPDTGTERPGRGDGAAVDATDGDHRGATEQGGVDGLADQADAGEAAGRAEATPSAANGSAGSDDQAARVPVGDPEPDGSTVARERDEYLALARRTQADFENYRKRAAKDMAAAGSRARVGLIREILPVVDNLERALASAASGDEGLIQGVRLVLSDLRGVLARTGVEAIEPAGAVFDPNVHEALTTREQEGIETGVVLDVVEKGYRVGDTVIRPARVVVAA